MLIEMFQLETQGQLSGLLIIITSVCVECSFDQIFAKNFAFGIISIYRPNFELREHAVMIPTIILS